MIRLAFLRTFLFLGFIAIAAPAHAVDDCATVSMTVVATQPNDPGFEGLYKYTVTGGWDVHQFGLSHIDFFIALKNLECVCDPRVVKFPAIPGTSNGVNGAGSCTEYYNGEYNCMGDPTVPQELRAPTVKFNAIDGNGCEAAVTGTGTWIFYSPFPPAPFTVYSNGVAIKHGQQVCTGDLAGQMPLGDCSTAAEARSWGSVKSLYR